MILFFCVNYTYIGKLDNNCKKYFNLLQLTDDEVFEILRSKNLTSIREKGKIATAYPEALKEVAKNQNGAMNGFVGMSMLNMNMRNITKIQLRKLTN